MPDAKPSLVEERIVCRQTTLSVITDCPPPDAPPAQRPVLLLLHGLNRGAGNFLPFLPPYREWAHVMVPDLPGSGRSEPPLEVGIEPLAGEIVSLVRRRLPNQRPLIIGESMGGLVGLACCDGRLSVAGLVLLDPPLSMAKQWVVQHNIDRGPWQGPKWFSSAMASAVFGVDSATGLIEERLHYQAFARLAARCLILCGDVPLFPVRTPTVVPSCFDDVDELIVRMMQPGCRIERLRDCGHVVFAEGGMRCHDLIRNFSDALHA